MRHKTVLVVGGAGYIGSHIVKMLQQNEYDVVVLDNLKRGDKRTLLDCPLIEGDMGDQAVLDRIFTHNAIDAVMHFAAFIDVGESVRDPLTYYQNNVCKSITLLQTMLSHGVKKLVFSSTAAIFGVPQIPLIDESHPCAPINAYGSSKWILEKILHELEISHGLKSCCLRYFNAAGGDPAGLIKSYQIHSTNLIPLTLRNLVKNQPVTIYGTDYPTLDGTCIRDYIHIEDLGTAHLLGMKKLFNGGASCRYNLGNGNGYSVKQVIRAVEKVTGRKIQIIEGKRRQGDPAVLVANAQKAIQELNWQPKYPSLEIMIQHAWNALNDE